MARHLVNFHNLHESCTLYCPFCVSERVYQYWGSDKKKNNFITKRDGLKHLTNCAFRVEKIKNKKFVKKIIESDKKITPTSFFQCNSECDFKNELPLLKGQFRKIKITKKIEATVKTAKKTKKVNTLPNAEIKTEQTVLADTTTKQTVLAEATSPSEVPNDEALMDIGH